MQSQTAGAPAIEFRNVSLTYDEKPVLRNIDFTLARGEMLFLTGLSGSGKSVLLHLAMTLERPDDGQILVEGVDTGPLSEDQLLNLRGSRMGIVFQEDSLFTGLSVYDNVAYRLATHGGRRDKIDAAVMETLHFVGLAEEAEKFPFELSGGMRRRVELARALIGWPSIMLFDEPALGLDPITASQILDLIIRARDVSGISSIYVTKKLDEIPYLATHQAKKEGEAIVIEPAASPDDQPRTRVIVLDQGRIVFSGSVTDFEQSSLPVVTRLTHAENGTVISDFPTTNPWNKERRPLHPIL